MTVVVIRYRLAEADFMLAQKLALRQVLRAARPLTLVKVVALLSVIAAILIVPSVTGSLLTNLGLLVLCACAALAILWWGIRRARVRMYRSNLELNDEITVEALPDQLTFSSARSRSINAWDAFSHFVESEQLFMIWRHSRTVHVIPKRAFGVGELERFREILAAHLPDRPPARRQAIVT